MSLYGFRLRLARLVAPTAILVDPFPDERMVVFIRDGRTQMTLKAKTLTIETHADVGIRDFGQSDKSYRELTPARTFSGELA